MKTKKWLFVLFLTLFNLLPCTGAAKEPDGSADVAMGEFDIRKNWEPGSQLLVPNAIVPFMQVSLTSGTTEPLQWLRLARTGNVEFHKVFTRLVALDGYQRVIASVEWPQLGAEPALLYFRDTVLRAGDSMIVTIAGETKRSIPLQPENGKTIGLKVEAVGVGNATTPSPVFYPENLFGSTYTVNAYVQVGEIESVRRVGGLEETTVGPGRTLGALRFDVSSSESITSIPTFKIQTTGGGRSDFRDLVMVSADGTMTVQLEIIERPYIGFDAITVQPIAPITFPKGGITFYFRGEIRESFAVGGTIAISTAPSTWRGTRGNLYGYYLPVNDLKTIISSTVTVRGARLDVKIEAPGNQIVTSGYTATVLTIILDATESAEDVVVTELPIQFMTLLAEWKSDVYIRLVDASNDQVVFDRYSPASYEDRSALFIQDRLAVNYPKGIVVPKGTKKEILVRATFSPEAEGVYAFAVVQDMPSVFGVQSGHSVVPSITYGWSIFRAVRKG